MTVAVPVDESVVQQLMKQMRSFEAELQNMRDIEAELQSVKVSLKTYILFFSAGKVVRVCFCQK